MAFASRLIMLNPGGLQFRGVWVSRFMDGHGSDREALVVCISDCLVGDLHCGECNSEGGNGIGGVSRLDGKCHETLCPHRA